LIRRTFRWGSLLLILFLLANLTLAVVTNVPTHIDSFDAAVFNTLLNVKKPIRANSYEEELVLVREVQKRIFLAAPLGEPIPEYRDREPVDLINHGTGVCYDRSRTFDKIFAWLGFETRHVYILYLKHPRTQEPLSFWRAFFTYGAGSHAVTEVKTSHGWMLVDSNNPWISLNKSGEPVGADDLWRNPQQFDEMPAYFKQPYSAIRGMYSRRGQFYRPYIPYPELNWADFFEWLLWG